ncbi:hypothetical protein LX32DRAFT_440881 [Colletotrichum zoysiae]|uniref:Uncharacterized protein n=1 Tax=Colletotrichum zoysiae TaxID=1216348 RepID=A0AAD9HGC0_9PEZI|nr:hypothetical protein LX32DRAFT_440881 [Colletotrichum zoysiae]
MRRAAVSNRKPPASRSIPVLCLVAFSVPTKYVHTKGRDGLGLVGTCRPLWWKTLEICSYSSSTALLNGRGSGDAATRICYGLRILTQRLGARLSLRSTWAKGRAGHN